MAEQMGEGRLKRLEFTVVLAVVGFVAALAALALWRGVDEIVAHILAVPGWVIAALLGLSLFNYGLRAVRWHSFSLALGVTPPFGPNAAIFIGGFALTTTPGKAGEALRLWLLEKAYGYSYRRVTPLFVGDRLSDMLAILLLCVAGVGAFSDYAGWTFAIAGGMALLMVPFLRPASLDWLMNRLWGLSGRRAPRLFAKLRAALRGTARLFSPRLFGWGLALALVGWLAEAWSFQILLAVLGAEVTFAQAMFVFTFALIAGTLAMLPGGLGGTEAVMLALLTSLGIDFDRAIAATAIIRLTTLWFSTALGFAVLPWPLRLARRGRAVQEKA